MKPAEQLLRAIAPDDLEGFGCYVIPWQSIAAEFPQLHREGVLAYTSPHMARAIQSWLESQGQWVGNGFATIVFRERIKAWHEVLGIVCHELAHWLAWQPIAPQSQLASLSLVAEYAASDVVPLSPPWIGHELPFIRAAAHLSMRAGELVESITPESVRFSFPYTGIRETTWTSTLATELPSTGSIRGILTTDAPSAALNLWEQIDG